MKLNQESLLGELDCLLKPLRKTYKNYIYIFKNALPVTPSYFRWYDHNMEGILLTESMLCVQKENSFSAVQ